MTIANVEMAEAWDGAEGDHWAEHAERYESVGPDFWEALADALAFRVDDRVVDIGCGTGRSTRDAARIATSGDVLGIDLSRRMLERARGRGPRRRLDERPLRARRRPGPSVPDRRVRRGDQQLRRHVLRGSRRRVRQHRPLDATGRAARAPRLARARGQRVAVRAPQRPRRRPRPADAAARAARARSGSPTPAMSPTSCSRAGFVDIAIDPVDAPMRFGADADDAFAFVSTLGITRGLLHDLDPDAAAGAVAALRQTLADHETADGVDLRRRRLAHHRPSPRKNSLTYHDSKITADTPFGPWQITPRAQGLAVVSTLEPDDRPRLDEPRRAAGLRAGGCHPPRPARRPST